MNNKPLRIVSLVPSITELLFSLGLDEDVVGITKFCVHPQQWFNTKPRIGGTKNVDIEKIKQLQPTLVIANKEENVKEQVEALQTFSTVLITDVNDVQTALEMILTVGKLTNTNEQAIAITQQIETGFTALKLTSVSEKVLRVAYLIWKNPYMSVGGDTFIHDILQHCGCSNIFEDKKRYPATTIDEIRALHPHYVLLSSEPFPFKQKDINELQLQLPDCKIILVDGEMFSWYGSRLIQAAAYLAKLSPKLRIS